MEELTPVGPSETFEGIELPITWYDDELISMCSTYCGMYSLESLIRLIFDCWPDRSSIKDKIGVMIGCGILKQTEIFTNKYVQQVMTDTTKIPTELQSDVLGKIDLINVNVKEEPIL